MATYGPAICAGAGADLNTGWMRIGEWLSTHPPLVRRIVALDPRLGHVRDDTAAGTLRAIGILVALTVGFTVVMAFGSAQFGSLLNIAEADGGRELYQAPALNADDIR